MAMDMEREITELKTRMASLENENERLRAVNEVRNLISKMQYLHTANRNSDIADLFSQKDPDTRLYFGELGYWVGPEGPKKAGKMMDSMGGDEEPVGMMAMHLMANPVIQIAGDGQTAKAVFMAAGMTAGKNPKTGEPFAAWEWNRYGEDLIKEDGEWKLWHHHVYPLFRLGWDEKWEDQFKPKDMPAMPMPDDLKPDRPATPGDVFYSPDAVLPFIPVPPEPYETFDPEMSY